MSQLRDVAMQSKAWPYEEARRLLKRYAGGAPEKGYVLFETGYGPSGLPHIGTFNEVLRTTMVRRAFEEMSDIPSRLIAFSDDMDGLRKVPDNVPNQDMLREHLGKPLTAIPDPFGKYESFAHHNNAMLRAFLDRFGFEYEFLSATECYRAGRFDETLKQVLRHYQDIMDIMLPTLGKERQATYSPVLPVSPSSGRVLQVPMAVLDAETGLVRFEDEGELIEQSILSGGAKLQWKVDWAMRWVALGVDYEMSGKDLIDSVTQSSKIARALGGRPPEGFTYEMFLDEKGEKISKSKGNGLSLEQWLTYGPEESLAFYAYREPKKAKQLHLGVIPRAVDEYWQFRASYPTQELDKKLGNPVHHIHGGKVPEGTMPVTFGLLLNLVTNPVGAFLPGPQAALEADWKRELRRRHGVTFNRLYTITNMPISRYLEWLIDSGNLEGYMERLVAAFNPAAVGGLMCRNTLSVAWDGRLYDCDFNQMLELGVESGAAGHIRDFHVRALEARTIVVGRHCFGCTAGAGSSCGGSTVK